MTVDRIDFIIPLRHPDNMRDRVEAMLILRQTVRSVLNQADGTREISIVANPMDELAEFEAQCNIVPVDLPPNRDHDTARGKGNFYMAVRRDKGLRLHAGLERSRAAYVMLLDDDDFVHRDLSGFIVRQAHPNGWFVDKGYHWTTGTALLFPQNRFYQTCGSCHILRRDLLQLTIDSHDDLQSGIEMVLGSHLHLIDRCAALGRPLAPVPFRAAIKRRGHANAHSQTRAIDLRLFLGYVAKTARHSGLSDAVGQVLDLARYDRRVDDFGLSPSLKHPLQARPRRRSAT